MLSHWEDLEPVNDYTFMSIEVSIRLGYLIRLDKTLGPVVQNFVSLTLLLLSPQFVNYMSTLKANTLLFFVEKM